MKALKYIVWILMITGTLLLFISLRYSSNQFEFAIGSAVVFGIAYLLNYFLKRQSN